jgi:hypothetical protein
VFIDPYGAEQENVLSKKFVSGNNESAVALNVALIAFRFTLRSSNNAFSTHRLNE